MFGWMVPAALIVFWVLIMSVESTGAELRRYHQDVAALADARGWVYRKGGRGRTWQTSLPCGYSSGVNLQVDGTRSGHEFTLVYMREARGGLPPVLVESTVVVVFLPSAYPVVEIKPRALFSRPTAGTIGHAAFDKKFRVKTRMPGGPGAVVGPQLAEAHVADDVPLWSLRDRELMCHTSGQTRVEDLDITVVRAMRVAGLLSVASGHAGQACGAESAMVVDCLSMEDGRDAHVRISNAERDQAMSMLGVHMSTGRLDLPEYEDRCSQAAAARTRADLEALFEDLPLPHPDLSAATRPTPLNRRQGQLASRGASTQPPSERQETPLSSVMETVAGLTLLLGFPASILLTIQFGMWWIFLPVMALMIIAGTLSEAFKKPPR